MVPAAWRGEMTVRGLYGAGLLGYAFFLPGSSQGLGLANAVLYLSYGLYPLSKLVCLLPCALMPE